MQKTHRDTTGTPGHRCCEILPAWRSRNDSLGKRLYTPSRWLLGKYVFVLLCYFGLFHLLDLAESFPMVCQMPSDSIGELVLRWLEGQHVRMC